MVRVEDTITRKDLRVLYTCLYDDRHHIRRSRAFVDLSDMHDSEVGFREILWFTHHAGEARKHRTKSVHVAIHAPGGLAFGIARIYQQLMEIHANFEVLVTADRRAAMKWLGLPEAVA